jgi:hypothetical protein
MDNEYLYMEGDEITALYFLRSGKCAYVLPKYENQKYVDVQPGSDFGMEDIVGSIIKHEEVQEDWISHKDKLIRQFTVVGDTELKAEVLLLSINDLNRMQQEFMEAYEEMFMLSYKRLEGLLKHKITCFKKCEKLL